MSWLDAEARTPIIDLYAQQLDSFIATIADGKVDENEVQNQESTASAVDAGDRAATGRHDARENHAIAV